MDRTAKWAGALIAAALFSQTAVIGGAGAEVSPTPLARLAKATPLPRGATNVHLEGAGRRFSLTIGLAPRDPAAFDAFVNDVATPGSPEFRRFLRRGEYAKRFGPTTRSLAPLLASLSSAGFHVESLHPARQYLRATGTAKSIAAFFHTTMTAFRTADGEKAFAATAAIRVDASVRALVTGVTGLSSLGSLSPSVTSHRTSHVATPSCQTASDYAASSYGVTTTQLAGAYGLDRYYSAGNTGQGTTIGIYELARYKASDITAYARCYGVTPTITNVNVDGGPPAYSSAYSADATEPTLDIEHVISIAPGAAVYVYQAPNSTAANPSAPNDLLARIAADDLAQVITTSWGLCEADNPDPGGVGFENGLFKQMAAQGQTFIASSGDNGPADCAGNGSNPVDTSDAVDDPASQPYVTGVGATRTTSFNPLIQSAWGRGSLSGGGSGGGISAVWTRPSWQVVSSTDSRVTSATKRLVPDVALNGDPRSGVLIYQSDQGGWFSIGGTSAASPLLAAIVALAATSCQRSLGFLNPALYAAAQASSANFADVASGTTSVGSGTVFSASVGYDLATGLGTPLSGAFDSVCATSPLAKSSSTLVGRPTTVGVTFSTPANLQTGDTVTVTWPVGLTLPSNPQSLVATANGDPSALSYRSTTSSTSSLTPNQVTFLVTGPLSVGSLIQLGATSAINANDKVPQNVSVSSSSSSWVIVGASLPPLTGFTAAVTTRDVTASNRSLSGKAVLGGLDLSSATTTQAVVVGTKVIVASGTAPSLSALTISFSGLTKTMGTFSGPVQFVKSGSTSVLAGVSTTGHLLIARATNQKAKWPVTDVTKSSGLSLVQPGALCLTTSGSTPLVTGAVRLSNDHLATFQATTQAVTTVTLTDRSQELGQNIGGTPSCIGDATQLLIGVRAAAGDLLAISATAATILSVTDLSTSTTLGAISSAPIALSMSTLGVALTATTTTGRVIFLSASSPSSPWTTSDLATSAASAALITTPVIFALPSHYVVAGWTKTNHLVLFAANGPSGSWNAYDATTTWGLNGSAGQLRGAVAASSSVLSWIAANGHVTVAATSVSL